MLTGKIDDKLIDEYRLLLYPIFIGDKNSIVPSHLEHQYLMSTFNISKTIKEYYCSPCIEMISEQEYLDFQNQNIVGHRKTFLKPYMFNYRGAYIFRNQFHFWLFQITKMIRTYKNKSIENFEDLFPILEEYKVGFEEGYNNFEKDCVERFFTMFPDKNDFIQKTFEYVTKNIPFTNNWIDAYPGFTINIHREITDVKSYGIKQGYFYKAWTIILSNSILYEKLFENLIDTEFKQLTNVEKNKLDNDIENIELMIRELISEKIDEKVYKETVSQNLRDKVVERISSYLKKYPEFDKSEYTTVSKKLHFFDLMELCELIINKKNWIVFEDTFFIKDNLTDKFKKLGELHNCIRHSREINEILFLEGKASIIWFNKVLGIKR
ncbi:hypothetical protein [uncultured Chryseobacterium sp.]|uniref:hypothetical protein n=1 Tax=uncultured Chryseobacterium sp. TaxID=259322 RepID=UPI0025EA0C61|nr:hypothetical protein [uncultured Chryseobacterium sp.]